MTPAARANAAIALLDLISAGVLADRALADWGRRNRYAGSKDRAAIADLVYDILRQKRSLAALGGGETGRALMLGYLRDNAQDPETIFGVGPYGPEPLSEVETASGRLPQSEGGEAEDIPAWLWPAFQQSLGDQAVEIARIMRRRAPVHLRVNLAKSSRDHALVMLAEDGVTACAHPLSPAALEVLDGPRKIKTSEAYRSGHAELQDAASQAVADMVPLEPGQTLLDYCAGGGGKTLAVAGRVSGSFFAHDVNMNRMKDLPARAARADVCVTCLGADELSKHGPFDTVLVDAPCSGSGAWRRDPQGKWRLTPDSFAQIRDIQREILDHAIGLVQAGGHLVYATCSLLHDENASQVSAFLDRRNDVTLTTMQQFTPLDGGDGFFCAVLRRR